MKRFHDLREPRRRFSVQLRPALLAALLLTFLLGGTVRAQSTVTPPTAGQVSVARLNLRSAPSISAPVVARLTQDATVQILSASADGRWYEVSTTNEQTGWLYAVYITLASAASDATASAAPEAAPTTTAAADAAPTGAAVATTTPARMNVRGGPGTNFTVVASAPAGSRFEIIGLNPARDWYQVRLPDRTEPAWIFANLATVSGSVESVPQLAEADLPAAPVAAPAVVTTASSPPATAPAAAPNTGTGFGHGVTVNMWQGDKQGVADLVKRLGFGWVKQQVRWEYAEPQPGAVQWQEMDAIVDAMSGNGINLMFSVVTSPPWTRPTLGGTGGPPEDRRALLRAAAGHRGLERTEPAP